MADPTKVDYGTNPAPIKALLLLIIRSIVSREKSVRIETICDYDQIIFSITVHPADVSKIIGSKGSTIEAIQLIANAVAADSGCRLSIEIVRYQTLP